MFGAGLGNVRQVSPVTVAEVTALKADTSILTIPIYGLDAVEISLFCAGVRILETKPLEPLVVQLDELSSVTTVAGRGAPMMDPVDRIGAT